ncbi:family 43 glycosylhydrolase [Chitinophaga sancti]|uniref:Beta-xylosidase n=1 Tax=Chitinophaga sancti TaxID=1004 RepID=A0A1K1NGR2_9BACT|nr:family 43 glycosylhydrolase [Chitinophaga sancti]WQD63238.1 family 43 glycosylhydrolase [Chitinophaga sancti]WQG91136.1 family 43 glycosylhydrolase [Chitinophaga sancti]SFW34511.1 Beta-xylosidase [Chitinophaga sancti]
MKNTIMLLLFILSLTFLTQAQTIPITDKTQTTAKPTQHIPVQAPKTGNPGNTSTHQSSTTELTSPSPIRIPSDTTSHLIFPGDFPDPSILVDGTDYYIVHSSFDYYPGLLIWHSKDLLNWTPLVNALHKYVGSVWAPDLVKYGNKYYIYFPANNTNYVVYADKITGPWSDPVDLKIGNIDPGHAVDANGKRYLYFSSGGYVPLSDDGLSVQGKETITYTGWAIPREWTIECFCLEGPKITKHGDYYYLTVAEGGTAGPATGHMIISARSKSPLGPWENSPYNPIIRVTSSDDTWWSKGHGTPFQDANGNWWMVFHGYEKDHYNMGRQTLIQALEWTKDGWFKTKNKRQSNEATSISKTGGITNHNSTKNNIHPSPNILHTASRLSDDFSSPRWKFFGEYDTTRFHISSKGIDIKGKGNSAGNSSPFLIMPTDHSYTAEVELEISGDATGGMVLFYNNTAYYGILADKQDILANLRGYQFPTVKNAINKHTFLKIENRHHIVSMYYSTDGHQWQKIENAAEISGLHHNALGGFLSVRIGLCSIGNGSVLFRNFKYEAIAE